MDLQGVEVRPHQRGVHLEGLGVEATVGGGGCGCGWVLGEWQRQSPVRSGSVAALGGEQESYEGEEE
ncbi:MULTISPECIES: hypothetical protein [unclassified Streptomyces]|uniref:hypothetical protein n=1 Tax=unclassified Streptomyces TaxID=2593676 RepID=UPI0004BEE9B8|nr:MULTISPECIES: hypothetical protein [unclassified Streptomyces]